MILVQHRLGEVKFKFVMASISETCVPQSRLLLWLSEHEVRAHAWITKIKVRQIFELAEVPGIGLRRALDVA